MAYLVRKKGTEFSVADTMAPRKEYNPIPLDASIYMQHLHQEKGILGVDIVRRYKQYARSFVYEHMVLPIGNIKDLKIYKQITSMFCTISPTILHGNNTK